MYRYSKVWMIPSFERGVGTPIQGTSAMAEVLFFILGCLFSLMLVLAIVVMLTPVAAVAGVAAPVDRPRPTAEPRSTPRTLPRSAAFVDHRPPSLASPARISASEREAYRVARALDQADRALSLIARKGESQAAKIASQTLRRLQTASEPPAARLTFARSRLELLSLRPEPWARAEAAAALAAMA